MTTFDFMGKRKIAAAVSIVLVVVSVGSVIFLGVNRGLDFTGGGRVELGFETAVTAEQIRALLTDAGYTEGVVQSLLVAFEGGKQARVPSPRHEEHARVAGQGIDAPLRFTLRLFESAGVPLLCPHARAHIHDEHRVSRFQRVGFPIDEFCHFSLHHMNDLIKIVPLWTCAFLADFGPFDVAMKHGDRTISQIFADKPNQTAVFQFVIPFLLGFCFCNQSLFHSYLLL